jgi:hypothetical protein
MAILPVSSSNKDQDKDEISAKRLFPDAEKHILPKGFRGVLMVIDCQ